MKNVLTVICIVLLTFGVASAASYKCHVGSIAPVEEGETKQYIEIICPEGMDILPGTELKVKIKKKKTAEIEGC